MHSETIAAIATPLGRGALSMVRVSGWETRRLLSRCFVPHYAGLRPRRATLGSFLAASGEKLDQVVVTFYPSPASYTGEDVAEICCHGSPVIARQILASLLAEGSRLAQPGEFTFRAFVNGKMDLAQAEAVRDLIDSQTAFQAQLAREQLQGALSQKLSPMKQELIRVLCHMETTIEFVEDQVEPRAREELLQKVRAVEQTLAHLEESFRWGKMVHEGLVLAIAGRTNAGKSSLFNALLKEERAIVTPIPGTTRDALSESISLEGVPARLIDTAGIRETSDTVESLGVRKSLEQLKASDLVLFILDSSEEFTEEDACVWRQLREQAYLIVRNKCDRPQRIQIPAEVGNESRGAIAISALYHQHLDELKSKILEVSCSGPERGAEQVVVTNLRHQECLRRARAHLEAGAEAYAAGLSEEFPLYDFKKALDALGEITGETSAEDLLREIFATFCIGK
ncbi:MAG: tRNA uridine-5-carboxymethylaminomethyl(34) synthesis GTPase MnmE [Acidobacteria bacterium]|nr:tRNA uridine-5-carboxymethylaminomethyl(34) synthesis GTPase MnmE [Acidobacteriota bacterium]